MEQAKEKKETKMKKLMIVAAAAAMVATSEAAYQCSSACSDNGCAAVYKIAISLKTTAPKSIGAKCAECTTYRVQKSMKINGYIWGEGVCDDCSLELPSNISLWSKAPVETDLHLVAGRIGKPTGTQIEAHGDLGGPGDSWGWLKLAGFGSVKVSKMLADECDECSQVYAGFIKNLSGNIAGWRVPDDTECEDGEYICAEPIANTAAYGTWKIAYNKDLSKKLACSADVDDLEAVVKFPKAAYAEGDLVIGGVDTNVEE